MSLIENVIIPVKAAIETQPPVVFASRLALNEGNRKKPIYQMHKWWARRLGSVFRSLLLAATTPKNNASILNNGFFYNCHDFSELRVLDPFMGGGTSLIEAAKCGASVIGVDIDPVACFVTAKELEACDEQQLTAAFQTIESSVKEELLQWYRTTLPGSMKGTVMHAFWVDEIECPSCGKTFQGHPHFQLRRFQHLKKQTVFCSRCGDIATVPLTWKKFTCTTCRTQTNIENGPVRRGVFICPECDNKTHLHALISEGQPLRQRLFALEVLQDETDKRVFKKADKRDYALFSEAKQLWLQQSKYNRFVPTDMIPVRGRDDLRPVSLGYRRYRDLFNPRQLLCLSILAKQISRIKDHKSRELLALAFSDSLAANNMFCFYAFDYGKLTPLFGLHTYAKVSRPVENNVWGTKFGRGSFSKCFNKLVVAKRYAIKPFEYEYSGTGKPVQRFTGESISCKLYKKRLPSKQNGKTSALLLNQSSEELSSIPAESIDIILSDPPYYNNLAYSELSDFYHVWLKRMQLPTYHGNGSKHTPLKESLYVSQRSRKTDETHKRFFQGLSRIFAECYRVIKDSGLFVFTFHHNDPEAWAVLAQALLISNFHVTNVFPVRSEGQSRFHSDAGNIKWDEVIVCRKRKNPHRLSKVLVTDELYCSIENQADQHVSYWKNLLKEENLRLSPADERSLKSGLIIMCLSERESLPEDLESLFARSYSVIKLNETNVNL